MKHKWLVGCIKCKSCGKQWVAVRRADTDDDKLECPRCHKQNSEIVGSDKK